MNKEKLAALSLVALAGFAAIVIFMHDKMPPFQPFFPLSTGGEKAPGTTINVPPTPVFTPQVFGDVPGTNFTYNEYGLDPTPAHAGCGCGWTGGVV